jgi:hypothetical protein
MTKYPLLRAHLNGRTMSERWADQYRMSASSCCSSVPAATVKPSSDTSQERRAFCFPWNGTGGRQQVYFEFARNIFLRLHWPSKLHVLSIATKPVRSSQTRTTPSLPEDMTTLRFMPATESIPRKDVVPPWCPSKDRDVRRDDRSNKYILLDGVDADAA